MEIHYKSEIQKVFCEHWINKGWNVQMVTYLGLKYPMVIPPIKSDYKNVKIIDGCGYDVFVGFAFDLLRIIKKTNLKPEYLVIVEVVMPSGMGTDTV